MLGINRKLKRLQQAEGLVRVGLIGAGQMGRGMISQIESMLGMRVVVTADIQVENAKQAYRLAGVSETDIVETNELEKAEKVVSNRQVVVTTDSSMVLAMSEVDVVVDATGIPEVGAKLAWQSIMNKKHIVMLNVEADVTVGPVLKRMADAAGVVYTGSAGDEPGAIMELYDFADAVGFDIVALGKGKNNPLNLEANPDSAAREAKRKKMNPKMLASFQDGTKTMVEMNAVANATGFVPDVPGMHGPSAKHEELPSLFDLKENGGILSRTKVVDYVNGVAPGVFAIIASDKDEVNEEMAYLKMGDGPQYLLFRPYHLTSLETPLSVAKAYFEGEATIAPWHGIVADTVAVAKKDLHRGDALDGIGGYTFYGSIMLNEEARDRNALPIGLAGPHVVLKKNVKQGEIITYDDVDITRSSVILELRRLQENME